MVFNEQMLGFMPPHHGWPFPPPPPPPHHHYHGAGGHSGQKWACISGDESESSTSDSESEAPLHGTSLTTDSSLSAPPAQPAERAPRRTPKSSFKHQSATKRSKRQQWTLKSSSSAKSKGRSARRFGSMAGRRRHSMPHGTFPPMPPFPHHHHHHHGHHPPPPPPHAWMMPPPHMNPFGWPAPPPPPPPGMFSPTTELTSESSERPPPMPGHFHPYPPPPPPPPPPHHHHHHFGPASL